MTCYFRHLQQVFSKAGIEVTKENRKELDMIIHKIMRVDYKNCPATWKEEKKRLAQDEAGFIAKLKAEWNKHARTNPNQSSSMLGSLESRVGSKAKDDGLDRAIRNRNRLRAFSE